ncbi:MAG: PD-(D/E)XK nuclease family protein [Pseudomonadota bacterium]
MAGSLSFGPFSASFERSFLNALSTDLKDDSLAPRVVLVGSNLLGIHLRHALSLHVGGHINVRFVTFVDLARRLTRFRFLETRRRVFPLQAEDLLLEDLCGELPPSSSFHAMAHQRGLHEALRRTFHDLIDGGLTQIPGEEGKLGDLGRIFRSHRARYIPRFATNADVVMEASSEAGGFHDLFGTRSLYVYGFYDLTETQRRLLRAIALHASLHVWVPTFGFASSPDAATLRFLRTLKLAETPLSTENPPVFSGMSAPHAYAEAEEGVRWMIAQMERASAPMHQAGILLRDFDAYAPCFEEILERAQVPFYAQGGRPIASMRAAKALLWLLSSLGTEGARNDLVEFLSLFPFKEEFLKGVGGSADWDRWTRRAVVSRGFEQAAARLSAFSKPENKECRNLASFVRRLASEVKRLEQSAVSWSGFGAAVASFLETFAEPDPVTDLLSETAQSLSDLEEVGVAATPERTTRILTTRIRAARLRDGKTFERDGVYLGLMVSARLVPFRVAVIPGLVERSFPAPPQTDPLLLDHERRFLNGRCGTGIALKESRLDEERALFHLARSQASSVLLTYPRASREGLKERLPSTFFRDSVPKEAVERRPHMAWAQKTGKPLLDEKDWVMRDLSRRMVEEPERTLSALEAALPLAASTHLWVTRRLGSDYWTDYDGMVRHEMPPSSQLPPFSSSQIERYATCPYRYFLSNVIGLEPIDAPEDVARLRPLDRGRLIHRALFRFFSRLKNEERLPLRKEDAPGLRETLRTVAAEVFAEAEQSVPLGHQLLWETERAFLISDLAALLDAELKLSSLFVPYDFEVRFGTPARNEEEGALSTDSPVEIRAREGTIRLKGRVDRVDLSPDGKQARILDYKTGSFDRAHDNAFDNGRSVQLAVYLLSLRVLLPGVDAERSEASLLSTAYGGGFRTVSFSGVALKAREPEFVTILDTVVQGIRAGFFPPNPGSNLKHCQQCDFTRICGSGVGRVFERKEADPAISTLNVLKEIE